MPESQEAKAEEGVPVVKAELKEDADAPRSKKRERKRKDAKDEPGAVKKDEGAEEDADDAGNEDDAMAPEAEPTHPRNEVPEGTSKFRDDAVHVYGLDFLKTGHMQEIFGQFNHRFVEWINDSSANVVFKDAASARKALESLSYPKAGDDPWRRTPDILVRDDLPAVYLQMRLAAVSDAKSRKKGVPSMRPGKFVEESQQRNPQFTVANLYDEPKKAKFSLNPDKSKAKRVAKELPAEELAKRAKRADRFVDTLDKPAPAAADSGAAPDAKDGEKTSAEDAPKKVAIEAPVKTAEELEEETSKRQQRAARFGGDKVAEEKTPDKTNPVAAEAEGGATTEDKDTPAEK